MKIYIVQRTYYDSECSGEYNIKAFVKKEKAEEFKKNIELKAKILHDKIVKISIERENEKKRINSMNLTHGKYLKKLSEIGWSYVKKRKELIKESGIDFAEEDVENENFIIEELELVD